MKHRHLLPNEIDLLVDGEAGFGVAPLRAHLDECGVCQERFEDAFFVVQVLEDVPHFAPDARLADRVMAQVPVFVPVHVAARDSVQRWLPQAGIARLAAAVLGTFFALGFTLALAWLATRGEAVMYGTELLGGRLRGAVVGGMQDLAVAMLGPSALAALETTGPVGTTLIVLGFVLTAAASVAGIRRLAVSARGD